MYNPQLETFLCVAECGSFNKAAEKLFISPPAVIKQINLLEENLDLQLFVRTHRGLQLTEAGKSLAQDAKYIIQYCWIPAYVYILFILVAQHRIHGIYRLINHR